MEKLYVIDVYSCIQKCWFMFML